MRGSPEKRKLQAVQNAKALIGIKINFDELKPRYPSAEKKYVRQKRKESRQEVLRVLGGKCVRCGFGDERALQIDHVYGNGPADRKLHGCSGVQYYKRVIRNFKRGYGEFQLLCANCNWIKRAENKEIRK